MKKRLITFILIMATAMNISAQTLTERQLLLCACASLEAQGDLERLDPAIRKALDGGVTVNELAAWNNIANPNLILIGQKLKIYIR